ncbi:hypothetical protein BSL78_02788, partial [Apostichopus japonicus]
MQCPSLELLNYIQEPSLAYSLVDSSRVSTFLISILLIVYGSFRSLNMEQEERKDREPSPLSHL